MARRPPCLFPGCDYSAPSIQAWRRHFQGEHLCDLDNDALDRFDLLLKHGREMILRETAERAPDDSSLKQVLVDDEGER